MSHSVTPNPLFNREPELVERLAEFRDLANYMLLDKLAAAILRDPSFRAETSPHPLEDVRSTALVLRMLTKISWDQSDMRVFDACWKEATRSELFADEFEAERHFIEQNVTGRSPGSASRPRAQPGSLYYPHSGRPRLGTEGGVIEKAAIPRDAVHRPGNT
jgi:hypothetical protein